MSSSLVVCIFGALLCGISLMTAAEKFTHQYVFEWTKVLTNQEIYAMLAQKEIQWPVHDSIPPPSFSCPQKQYPGFYADPATQCQTFHRCDINGNLTSYICVNTTVFNPITLVCDHWFNVDCDSFVKDEYFGNRHLYTPDDLFDTPATAESNSSRESSIALTKILSKSFVTNTQLNSGNTHPTLKKL